LDSIKRWPEITITNASGGRVRHSTLKNDGELAAVMNLPSEAEVLPCRRSCHPPPKERIPCICSPPRRERRRETIPCAAAADLQDEIELILGDVGVTPIGHSRHHAASTRKSSTEDHRWLENNGETLQHNSITPTR
jgi:hypothetical protein